MIKQLFHNLVPYRIRRSSKTSTDWGNTLQTFWGHKNLISSIAFSADGQLLASISLGELRLWDTAKGSMSGKIETREPHGLAVTFLQDSRLLAYASNDMIEIWDTATEALHDIVTINRAVSHGRATNSTAIFSPGGQLLAVEVHNAKFTLLETTTEICRGTTEGHAGMLMSVAFSSDAKSFVSTCNREIKLWNLVTLTSCQIWEAHVDYIRSIAFAPNGDLFVLEFPIIGSTIKLWKITVKSSRITSRAERGTQIGRYQGSIGTNPSMMAMRVSPDGKLLAISNGESGQVKLWDIISKNWRGSLDSVTRSLKLISFSPKDQSLACVLSEHPAIRLWDTAESIQQNSSGGDWRGRVHVMAFSQDFRLLISAASNGRLELWDTETGVSRGTLEGHAAWIESIAIAPNGQSLAFASRDWTVKLWDMDAKPVWLIYEDLKYNVRALTYSPDSKILAIAADNASIELWDLIERSCIASFEGHLNRVMTVAFSPNGEFLASGSYDKTIKLWDIRRRRCRETFEGDTHMALALNFSLDSQFLASLTSTKTVKLWKLATMEPIEAFPTNGLIHDQSLVNIGIQLVTSRGTTMLYCHYSDTGLTYFYSWTCQTTSRGWITWGDEDFLHFPEGWRVSSLAVRNGLLALGHENGQVSIIEIDLHRLKIES